MCSSLSCASVTLDGASIMTSCALLFIGNAMTSRMYDCGGSNGTSNRAINDKKEYGNDNGYYYSFFDAFTSSDGNYESSTGYCNSKGIRNYVIPERTAYSDCHGATRWFRFDYYVCSYADYVRMYQYIKIEDGIESTSPVSASDTISNVQEWVLYREK